MQKYILEKNVFVIYIFQLQLRGTYYFVFTQHIK